MKIAVLDDNITIGEMVRQGLEIIGHSVVVYTIATALLTDINAEEPRIISAPFDLIIVDLILSEGFSGVEVIHQVRSSFPNLPAILISAASSWEVEDAKRTLPTMKFLRKPFKISALLAMTNELVL